MAENPIHHLLDDRRFPWRDSQADLIERYGAGADPWFNREAVVFVDSAPPLLPDLLRPLHFEPKAGDDPSMPPLLLWGWAWAGRTGWWRSRAMSSLKLVRESLEPTLGPPEPYHTSNTRGWRWRCGPAWIETWCFPPRLALPPIGTVIPDRRDERVNESCWIKLFTGYRLACTAAERAEIASFEPAITLREPGDPQQIVGNPPGQRVLEYVREPFAGFERTIGRIGRSRDGETLIFASDQLHVVPTAQVDHVHVERILPARGIGRAEMSLACRGDFGSGPVRNVFLAFDQHWDGLNEIAGRVADWLGKPCVLGEYELDD